MLNSTYHSEPAMRSVRNPVVVVVVVVVMFFSMCLSYPTAPISATPISSFFLWDSQPLASNPERLSTTIFMPTQSKSTPPISRKMHGVHGPGTEGGVFPQSTTLQNPISNYPPHFPKTWSRQSKNT